MTHVVTQACCGDASCVFACPVNAIHPTPDEPDFGLAEMLYIDPVSCVDCGACVTACPVGAIAPEEKLTTDQLPFVEVNALFHDSPRSHPAQAPVAPLVARTSKDELRVAIVGSGPAALYAADELLKRPHVRVNVFDRLPTPHGLVRAGVAPDHATTKTIEGLFRQIEDQDGFSYVLNVEVGTDLSHDELAAHHHAVVYATGASRDRRLGIPGEDLAGSDTATAFVAWYNGHPDVVDHTFDLTGERVVIVGNGNVALDVARVLATDPERLSGTDISDEALAALRGSAVREIVLVGRRGAAQAAFTLPELLGLVARDDIEIVVEGDDLLDDDVADPSARQKIAALRTARSRPARPGARRIVFRFATSPVEISGRDRVGNVSLRRNRLVETAGVVTAVPTEQVETIEAGLVLRSIGYRGTAVPGVPFDEARGTIANDGGRVTGLPGAYVTGWIKRGPSGFIGTNKTCAQETVDHLVADANRGLLTAPVRSERELRELVRSRTAAPIDLRGWRAIDRHERAAGAGEGRPRRKLLRLDEMLDVARSGAPERRRRLGLARR